MNEAEVVPLPGILIGFGLNPENVTPAGTEPVTDNVTDPEYARIEVPVIVTLPEAPCATETLAGVALSPKSGVEPVILATLFAPASNTHVLPDESTMTS